jgi:hypothetical protein
MGMATINIKMPKKNHFYADSSNEHKFTPNLLHREFYSSSMNCYWVNDITYIDTCKG